MSLVTVERSQEEASATDGETTSGHRADEESSSEPPRDAVFEILRANRRREVLRYLDDHGGEATIGALADHIAARENGVDPQSITSSQRKRVYVGLYQAHLPKMDGYEVVEWEKDRGFVRLRESAWWYLAYLRFDPADNGSSRIEDAVTAVVGAVRRLASR